MVEGAPATAAPSASPVSLPTKILGGAAGLLVLFLLVGSLLPAEWEARAEAHLSAGPTDVFRYVATPEGWRAWTPWPDSGLVRGGPAEGAGASLTWASAEVGSGVFTIVEVEPNERVRYTVEVEGGSMRTTGSVTLEPLNGGTKVTWSEEGDLGSNPLMGYWARSMGRAQSAELAKGLERLRAVLVEEAPASEAATDVGSASVAVGALPRG